MASSFPCRHHNDCRAQTKEKALARIFRVYLLNCITIHFRPSQGKMVYRHKLQVHSKSYSFRFCCGKIFSYKDKCVLYMEIVLFTKSCYPRFRSSLQVNLIDQGYKIKKRIFE
jgi:hypothetical protein